jgi:hypothetical protein
MKLLLKFLAKELLHKEFYLLLVCSFTVALMAVWRGVLRDIIFNRVIP